MTKVEQIDWSKFKPVHTVQRTPQGTRNFKKSASTKKGYIKSYKMEDKHLIAEQIANYNHLRTIRDEV